MEANYYNVKTAWAKDRKGILCSPEDRLVSWRLYWISQRHPIPKGNPRNMVTETPVHSSREQLLHDNFFLLQKTQVLNSNDFECHFSGKLDSNNGSLN